MAAHAILGLDSCSAKRQSMIHANSVVNTVRQLLCCLNNVNVIQYIVDAPLGPFDKYGIDPFLRLAPILSHSQLTDATDSLLCIYLRAARETIC